MPQSTDIKLFENQNIRSLWDETAEKWYFAITDIVGVLTDSPNPRKYWSVLKTRLKAEGSELTTKCSQLKMQAADGKSYLTDVGDTEQIFRIIQSVPSPKAEPFKLWLAKVGSDRIDEMADPEMGIARALDYYKRLGYSDGWIMQRLKSIEIRKDLTNEWERGGHSARCSPPL
ncbi:MAG: Bro-N domain-containing protein, partial [Rickettsiales bacterium]|nr:Bro-N domain-containing protein [Rickettsiales bacterium]